MEGPRLDDAAVEAAVSAYDEARCRVHGPNEQPMSERNRQTIAPMIRAALEAAAPLIRAQALEEAAKELEGWCDIYGKNAAASVRALKEPRATANGGGK